MTKIINKNIYKNRANPQLIASPINPKNIKSFIMYIVSQKNMIDSLMEN